MVYFHQPQQKSPYGTRILVCGPTPTTCPACGGFRSQDSI